MNQTEIILVVTLAVVAIVAAWALLKASRTECVVESVLSFDYLSSIVEDETGRWESAVMEAGGDATEMLEEINMAEFTLDVVRIAWHYPADSFEERLRETTRDLLDAMHAPGS